MLRLSVRHAKQPARLAIVVAAGLFLTACGALSLFRSDKGEPGAEEPYPNLSSVPERPEATESADDRRRIAEGLLADRSRVQHTDQALRGGTEPSAPPPPPPVAVTPQSASAESTGATSAGEEETEPEQRGFFGRLFGSKQVTESDSAEEGSARSRTSASPEGDTAAAAGSTADEPSQSAAESGTGAAAIEDGRAERRKPGFFKRLFGSKEKTGDTAAEPLPPATVAQPTADALEAPADESTGATARREEERSPGLFRRLFGGKKNTPSDAESPEAPVEDSGPGDPAATTPPAGQ
jgi:hypothetical protein